jgi:hypothetical protein
MSNVSATSVDVESFDMNQMDIVHPPEAFEHDRSVVANNSSVTEGPERIPAHKQRNVVEGPQRDVSGSSETATLAIPTCPNGYSATGDFANGVGATFAIPFHATMSSYPDPFASYASLPAGIMETGESETPQGPRLCPQANWGLELLPHRLPQFSYFSHYDQALYPTGNQRPERRTRAQDPMEFHIQNSPQSPQCRNATKELVAHSHHDAIFLGTDPVHLTSLYNQAHASTRFGQVVRQSVTSPG